MSCVVQSLSFDYVVLIRKQNKREMIVKNGKKVEFVPNNKCSVGWKIFYSDSKNVFLIADDYISVDMLPINKSGHKPKKRKLLKSCKF